MKKTKILTTYLSGGKTDFLLCQDGDKRWMEFPQNLKMEDDNDAEHIVTVIQRALPFIIGDAEIEEQ